MILNIYINLKCVSRVPIKRELWCASGVPSKRKQSTKLKEVHSKVFFGVEKCGIDDNVVEALIDHLVWKGSSTNRSFGIPRRACKVKQFNVVIHPNCWIFSEKLVFEIRCIEFIFFL